VTYNTHTHTAHTLAHTHTHTNTYTPAFPPLRALLRDIAFLRSGDVRLLRDTYGSFAAHMGLFCDTHRALLLDTQGPVAGYIGLFCKTDRALLQDGQGSFVGHTGLNCGLPRTWQHKRRDHLSERALMECQRGPLLRDMGLFCGTWGSFAGHGALLRDTRQESVVCVANAQEENVCPVQEPYVLRTSRNMGLFCGTHTLFLTHKKRVCATQSQQENVSTGDCVSRNRALCPVKEQQQELLLRAPAHIANDEATCPNTTLVYCECGALCRETYRRHLCRTASSFIM